MKNKFFLGLDIGGTKVEGAVASLDLKTREIQVYSKKRMAVDPKTNAHDIHAFIESLSALIHELLVLSNKDLSEISAIGLGLPGSLEPKTRIMLNGNTRFIIGHDVLGLLKAKLQCDVPLFAENDANLFALAESWGGAGLLFARDKKIDFKDQVMIGITLGTGVGGGLVSLGRVFSGAHGSAMEVGHICLDPEGPRCYCGQAGCAESYLSGTALNKLGNSKEIFLRAKERDPEAEQILKDYRKHLIHFLSILNNLFNPHYFVFGGGLSAQSQLFVHLKEDLEQRTFLDKIYCPEIYVNQLGDSSGLFGAMIYAQE